jgi:hypothetical protein
MVDAGTKYLAISFCSLLASELLGRTESFLLTMPSGHFVPASNTLEPEFPVVATSRITVGNFVRTLKESNCVDMMRERAVLSGTATILKRAGHTCEKCGKRRAAEIRHLTYIRVFQELPRT